MDQGTQNEGFKEAQKLPAGSVPWFIKYTPGYSFWERVGRDTVTNRGGSVNGCRGRLLRVTKNQAGEVQVFPLPKPG